MPPPERSGLKSLTTPVTQGNVTLCNEQHIKDQTFETIQPDLHVKRILKQSAPQLNSPSVFLSFAEVVCSSSQHEPAPLASTWWQPIGSSSSMRPGTPPTTSRVSSECIALASSRLSTSTGSLPRWAWVAGLFMSTDALCDWSAKLHLCCLRFTLFVCFCALYLEAVQLSKWKSYIGLNH